MYLNKDYTLNKQLDLSGLFKIEDFNIQVALHFESIENNLSILQNVLTQEREPEFCISKDCFECNYSSYCLKHIPENSIFNINRLHKVKAIEHYNNGVVCISDFSEDLVKNNYQKTQIRCTKEDKVHIDKEKIKETLNTLEYPLYFFDFEGYTNALPVFDGAKAYHKIPFQYSLHIKETPDSELTHKEFLAKEGEDPRKEIFESMINDLGGKGSIIVYHKAYEGGVIKSLGDFFPQYLKFAENFIARLWDLEDIFSNAYYYNPKQQGSNSIKVILPLFSDLSYKKLNINKGNLASIRFYKAGFGDFTGNKLSKKEIQNIRKDLLVYCEQDTLAMVLILEKLMGLVR